MVASMRSTSLLLTQKSCAARLRYISPLRAVSAPVRPLVVVAELPRPPAAVMPLRFASGRCPTASRSAAAVAFPRSCVRLSKPADPSGLHFATAQPGTAVTARDSHPGQRPRWVEIQYIHGRPAGSARAPSLMRAGQATADSAAVAAMAKAWHCGQMGTSRSGPGNSVSKKTKTTGAPHSVAQSDARTACSRSEAAMPLGRQEAPVLPRIRSATGNVSAAGQGR